MARAELTDDDWQLIEPFLPIGRFGPYPERLRQQFEAVIFRFRTGCPWRDIPSEFGAWQTIYHRFLKWRDEGVFEAVLDGMIAEAARRGQADLSLVSVDSTVARAHHDAAGMALREEALTALEEAIKEGEKGAAVRHKSAERGRKSMATTPQPPNGRNADDSGADAAPG